MGLEQDIGSLEVGKQADIIAVDLSQPETQPLYNPISQLVYACNGSQVSHSWVNGELLLEEGKLLRINTMALLKKIDAWQYRIEEGRGKP
jgi:5-methylthioadenosine/S-adenosylhomocysteine deaminase